MSGTAVTLTAPDGSKAIVQLHGAQITSWSPAGLPEHLFMAAGAKVGERAAMGGVPVIFPQFGDGPLLQHGFARDRPWRLISTRVDRDLARAQFRLTGSDASREIWPHDFTLELAVSVGAGRLNARLSVTNTDRHAWSFSGGLHTYLAVSDVADIGVEGLQHARFLDKDDADPETVQDEAVLNIHGATDRVYASASTRPVTVRDGGRTVEVQSEGFPDIVIWNPGPGADKKWPELGAKDHLRMLCVEAAIASQAVTLTPGARWHGGQTLTAAPLPAPIVPVAPPEQRRY